MPPPPVEAIARVTPALQHVGRLLHASPYAAAVPLSREGAERGVRRLLARYPSAAAHRNTQSALRGLDLPCVLVVVMPPTTHGVTVLLLANHPPDDREAWHLALDPERPLRWRGYEVTTAAEMHAEADLLRRPQPRRAGDAQRITWRLAEDLREEYRHTITRLVNSTRPARRKRSQAAPPDGGPRPGTTRSLEGARAQLEALGQHLATYPGLNGINVDRWMLRRHLERLWQGQHPGHPPPAWPRYPYTRLLPVQLAPLAALWPQEDRHAQDHHEAHQDDRPQGPGAAGGVRAAPRRREAAAARGDHRH